MIYFVVFRAGASTYEVCSSSLYIWTGFLETILIGKVNMGLN